ncbi:hypothetical protein SUGI_1195250 [Cryptomeria japonica]|nr:hypothetical protein SUGI_1195250 [Cryptomeria japonica]
MESKGFEFNTGDDNCENFNGNGMPCFSPLSTTFYRWPLRDISNLFCFEVGDILEPRVTNTPARRTDGGTSLATSARTNVIVSPSMSNSHKLRKGFR